MGRLYQGLRKRYSVVLIGKHRTAVLFGLGCWLVLWGLTTISWVFDATGQSVGMPLPIAALHLAAPAVAGAASGAQRSTRLGGLRKGIVAGFMFSLSNAAILLAWSYLLLELGRVRPGRQFASLWQGSLEALSLLAGYLALGTTLGMIGGVVGEALSNLSRAAQDDQQPPASMSLL